GDAADPGGEVAPAARAARPALCVPADGAARAGAAVGAGAARAHILRRLDRADRRGALGPVGPQALERRARPARPADRSGPEGGTLIMNALLLNLLARSPRDVPALDVAIKATLILAAAGVAALALRRSSAAARHLAWHLGLGAALALP